MKWASWSPTLLVLRRILRVLEQIAVQLRRLADAHEGITPAREVPPLPDDPQLRRSLTPADNSYFNRVYATEERLRRHLGHDPDPEQVEKELAGEEYGREDLTDAQRARLGL